MSNKQARELIAAMVGTSNTKKEHRHNRRTGSVNEQVDVETAAFSALNAIDQYFWDEDGVKTTNKFEKDFIPMTIRLLRKHGHRTESVQESFDPKIAASLASDSVSQYLWDEEGIRTTTEFDKDVANAVRQLIKKHRVS